METSNADTAHSCYKKLIMEKVGEPEEDYKDILGAHSILEWRNLGYSFEVIWSEMFKEFVSVLTNDDLLKMVERVHDITNDASINTSFGNDWFVVKDLAKSLTLNQLKHKWSDEIQKLLNMIEDQQVRRTFEDRLSFGEEDMKSEQPEFRPRELFSKDEEMHDKLARRRYRQRLTKTEKRYLSYLLLKNPDHYDYIKRTYKLSDWMCRELRINVPAEILEPDENMRDNEIDKQAPAGMEKSIEMMITPPKPPLTIKMLQEGISKAMGLQVEGHTISKIFRKRLKYSYKRGSSRPKKCTDSSNKYLKSIFSSRMLQEICTGRIVANIDEWGFSRMIKRHYSWLPVGRGGSILNQLHTGRCNLIMSIFSNGEWFGVMKAGTTNSIDYCLFLYVMSRALEASGVNIAKNLTIIQDNFAGHHSKEVKRLAKYEKLRMYFLPSYTPELAGI